jgi:hypothetical protein
MLGPHGAVRLGLQPVRHDDKGVDLSGMNGHIGRHRFNHKQTEKVLHVLIKSGIFDQPDLFDPKLTRHFLQYARRAHARISSSWHEPACMGRHA